MMDVYLKALACVARADGVITAEEKAAINHALRRVGVGSAVGVEIQAILDLAHPVNLDVLCRGVAEGLNGPPEFVAAALAEVVRDCYVVAALDGDVSTSEVEVIDRFLDTLRIPEARRATLHHWGEGAAQQFIDGVRLFADSFAEEGVGGRATE